MYKLAGILGQHGYDARTRPKSYLYKQNIFSYLEIYKQTVFSNLITLEILVAAGLVARSVPDQGPRQKYHASPNPIFSAETTRRLGH